MHTLFGKGNRLGVPLPIVTGLGQRIEPRDNMHNMTNFATEHKALLDQRKTLPPLFLAKLAQFNPDAAQCQGIAEAITRLLGIDATLLIVLEGKLRLSQGFMGKAKRTVCAADQVLTPQLHANREARLGTVHTLLIGPGMCIHFRHAMPHRGHTAVVAKLLVQGNTFFKVSFRLGVTPLPAGNLP